jgi:hypothetical protein
VSRTSNIAFSNECNQQNLSRRSSSCFERNALGRAHHDRAACVVLAHGRNYETDETRSCRESDGYLGGAIATHVRVGNPLYSHVLFPVYLGVLIWGGLFLRDPRLREFIPIRVGSSKR